MACTPPRKSRTHAYSFRVSEAYEVDFNIFDKEVLLKSVFLYTDADFEKAVSYVEDGRIDVAPLLSKTFPMSQAREAFEYKLTQPAVKVVLTGE